MNLQCNNLSSTTLYCRSLPLSDSIDSITVSKEDISCLLHMHLHILNLRNVMCQNIFDLSIFDLNWVALLGRPTRPRPNLAELRGIKKIGNNGEKVRKLRIKKNHFNKN